MRVAHVFMRDHDISVDLRFQLRRFMSDEALFMEVRMGW